MKTFAALFLAAVAGSASASEVLNLGSFVQNGTVRNEDISGMLSGGGYTSVQVTVDWSAGSGGPWSSEAIWALTDNDIDNATVFYADPGSASNSANDGSAVTLSWNTLTTKKINGANPLWFLSLQVFEANANWNNVTVTFGNDTAVAPSGAINLGVVATDTDVFDIGLEGSDFDTEIGLYNGWGGILGADDDSGTGLTSLLTGLQLEAGTYYFAAGGYDSEFATGFDALPGSDFGDIGGLINGIAFSGSIGAGEVQWYSFEVVPAPSSLALLGLGGLIAGRRRRA